MKKKLICIMGMMLHAVSIAGCGPKTKTTSEPKEEVVTEEENTTTVTGEDTEEVPTDIVKESNINLEEMYTTKDVEGGIAITQYNAFGENETVEIPNEINGNKVVSIGTVDEICDGFANDQKIKKIIIPDNIKLIGEKAFWMCHNLEMVGFGIGVEEIGADAFNGCNRLKDVKFAEGLKKLGEAAISVCIELETVSLPKSLTEIADGNFVACADDMVISAPSGSVAEVYAKSYEFTFQAE